jgi:hypothetical protein
MKLSRPEPFFGKDAFLARLKEFQSNLLFFLHKASIKLSGQVFLPSAGIFTTHPSLLYQYLHRQLGATP